MKQRKEDKGKSGIYEIVNKLNGKVYIGKAKCIYKRIKQHITLLDTRSKEENCHLINSWHKYGRDNFDYNVVEYLDLDEAILKERERFWIISKEALDNNKGYNLRLDTDTGLIIKDETRKKLSEKSKERMSTSEAEDKMSKRSKQMWKDDTKRKQIIENIKLTRRKANLFKQLDSITGNLIRIWQSIEDIIKENPTYKWQNIYSVCNGYKKRMYGYIWTKEKKI